MKATSLDGSAKQNLVVGIASGELLDVREFTIDEGISELFEVRVVAMSRSADVDFESAVGGRARFELREGKGRAWEGVASRIEQVAVEEDGLSTYEIVIVPQLWLLTQRRNYRVFQDASELDIVREVLAEWDITPRLDLDAASYGKRRYRTQYAESDFQFVSRMLEDAGIAYVFEESGGSTELVLVDAPNRGALRAELPFVSQPDGHTMLAYATAVRTMRQVKPGRYTQSDVDYRKPPDYPLAASAFGGRDTEARLERYHHNYGSFLWTGGGGGGGGTPHADDRGPARTNEGDGKRQVERRLDAQRVNARVVHFRTTEPSLAPGHVMQITRHPRAELGSPLLVVRGHLRGTATAATTHTCEARYTDVDFRPALSTPKPKTLGVESATVTGPRGEEIHTDEFGRIRLHFHWDREGANDETSSCWVPVSQPWAGAGFGAISIPRVGQEVLVDFLGADPDRPVVVGRVFTLTNPPPYALPEYKMASGLRSESYPRPRPQAQAQMGGGPLLEAGVTDGATGGGAPAGPLGGIGSALSSLAQTVTSAVKEHMPGPFGGPQAPIQKLVDAATSMNSHGPDKGDASRSGNGLVTHDTAGSEILYLQGQKDLRVVAKNNMAGGVGGNRAFQVLGNDHEGIIGYQATNVGKDRSISVTGSQTHVVQQDIQTIGNANHVIQTKSDFVSAAEGQQTFTSPKQIALCVGASTVLLRPDCIAIDSPLVLVNPGAAVMAALGAGASAAAAVGGGGG